tara:strand:+ start:214 stop:1470 length:1257 start_codon:yes stop_codon:yes gene_type:complete
MARVAKKLTNTGVSQAKPKDKTYELSDGEGLILRIHTSGTKTWLFKYHTPHIKKRTNLTLGSYPEISLANARIKRAAAKDLLAKEIDPKEHRNEISRLNEIAHNNTLEHVASLWLNVKKTQVSEDHAKDTLRSLELHIFPSLGRIPIHKINAVKTIETIQPLAAKGSLETVKRLCQRLNEIMIHSVNTGLIHHNPLAGISKAFKAPSKNNMPSISPDQLPALMNALSKASIKLTTRFLIEWQLHTMLRPSEAAGTRWDEIDFVNELWNIPAERMKKKRPHTVPLTKQTLDLLEAIRPISGKSEYVFTGDRSFHKPMNSSTANMALKRMGYEGILVAHGMRSIASTAMNEEGFDPDVIEACLAHVDKNEVRAAYNRADYIERRKKVMCWWSNYIEKAATGNLSLATSKNGLSVINGLKA